MTYRHRLAKMIAGALFALTAETAHAQECSDDGDCDTGSECIKPVSTSGCARGGGGGACDAGPPVEAEFGECSRVSMTCDADSDCAAGLTCEKHSVGACSRSLDGGAEECEVVDQPPGECVYDPPECEKTSECEGDLVCTALRESQECSGSSGACAPGDAGCPEPEPPVCTTIERKYCFPERVDCKVDADCDDDLRCVELPKDFQDDALGVWKGATRVCMPEGIALAIEDKVDSGGSSSSDSLGSKGGASSDAGIDADAVKRGPTDKPDASTGTGDADDSDCAVNTPGAHGSAHNGAALAALVGLALLRRRRRLQRGR